ncbi:MAG TPA: zf-HC2 domain-containing protein, partial [Ktedonobacterales bacterium]
MTCKQTRQLLAAYRREDLSPGESAELHAHLAECAECRARAAEFRQMGETLQALPKLAPPPDFYARVMAAVRAEEQQAAEKQQETVIIPGMTDVSYLPTVRRAVTERRARVTPLRSQMSPAGVFALHYGAGLAALFLIFAIGVSAGLFFLRSGSPNPPIETCVLTHTCSGLNTSVYTPDPAYPLVANATASPDGQYVIYAAHNASGNWMLEELNRQTQKSTALLPAPVAGPLVLEGWARSWVLWAQGDPVVGHQWQLEATELSPALPGAAQPLRLLQSNGAGPDGKVTALHGIAALGATVLLAEELADGHGQLVSLDLTSQSGATRTVIATAQQPNHLIADPTAAIADPATGAMTVYWAEQWQDPDGTLHGNIWRRLMPDSSAVPVTSNGVSFSPAIVAGKMFWLEEPPAQPGGPAAGQQAPTPTPTATGTATPGSSDTASSQVTGI